MIGVKKDNRKEGLCEGKNEDKNFLKIFFYLWILISDMTTFLAQCLKFLKKIT